VEFILIDYLSQQFQPHVVHIIIVFNLSLYLLYLLQVHGKRYAYKFDFAGLAQTMQPISAVEACPTSAAAAYKYQQDLFMSTYHHHHHHHQHVTSPLSSFMKAHHSMSSPASASFFPSPSGYWSTSGGSPGNLYQSLQPNSAAAISHQAASHLTSYISPYAGYA